MRGFAVAAGLLACTSLLPADTPQERLSDSAAVFSEIMAASDKGIPQDLLEKAECVVIVPSLKKGAFVVGAEYGRGFATCRQGASWTAPAAIKMEGGSVGFQIGGSSTDLVMLVMNQRGMDRLMSDKFTLGADASVAAGPVGRTANAQTDARLTAEILAWSRAKGLFAGVALKGATLRPDHDQNSQLYGRKVENREILAGSVKAPDAARQLISELNKYARSGNNADRSK